MLPKLLKKKLKSKSKVKGDFYESTWWLLWICRWTGSVPISGLINRDKIRFTWKSAYMVYFLPCVAINVIEKLFLLYGLFEYGIMAKRVITILYYYFIFIQSMLFFCLSRDWKNILTEVESVEKLLPPMYQPRTALRTMYWVVGIVITLTIGDHLFYYLLSMKIVVSCYKLPEDSGMYLKSYFVLVYTWFYNYVPFSYTSGFIIQIVKMFGTFLSMFSDLLITLSCMYLNNRFNTFNRYIFRKEKMNSVFTQSSFRPSWIELQTLYTRLSKLVSIVDKHINSLVFISYIFNLFHISQQLYYILNTIAIPRLVDVTYDCIDEHSLNDYIILYKVCNMSVMLFRTFLLADSAACLFISSKKPLEMLHLVPAEAFDWHMQRLMDQVYYSKVGITGLRFFYLTRRTMLMTFAKLLTYELVLVQF